MHPRQELPQKFADLGLEVRFLKALAKVGYVDPSEIQERLIPLILQGKDVQGQARTGTGKTAAFGLPVLQGIDPHGRLQAICLAPTRELAVQVAGEISRLAAYANLRCVAVYGGQKISTQVHQLGRRHHFVVGTPGRMMDMMRRGYLHFNEIKYVILDEVDRMLDIGFRDDIRYILSHVKSVHQTVFVSATINEEIKRLGNQYMRDAVDVDVSQDTLTVDEVDQLYCPVNASDKARLLKVLIDTEDPKLAIVFTNTKHAARKVAKRLVDAGISAKEIHGDLLQNKRDWVMGLFRKHKMRVLVATDLAARGIDVSAVTHIINYDVPFDSEVYIHRIGRTARMGARGTAYTFVTPEEGKQITEIEKLINLELREKRFDGFVPRSQPEPAPRGVSPAPSSTPGAEPVAVGAATPATATKRLGGKFRPRRRRRL
ncbi:MAG: DEAD/DEAH box helicase [Planctomycetes bacterium]|nr:DEAD/DEAH box helicase [Planctomycetota bacterium]